MAELEEVHAFWTDRRIVVISGKHAGKTGYCSGPCACYSYDICLDGSGEIITLGEGDFDLAPGEPVDRQVEGGFALGPDVPADQ